MDCTLTLEHIPPGRFPDWLFQQLRAQVLDPRLEPILVIHSSEASRAEILYRLESADIGPIDRSRHHTLASLRKSLQADLRLARLLPFNATGHRLLHAECELAARSGEFPLLHPTPEHRWGEGRTRALTRLTQAFDIEDVRSWDGPGIDSFENIVTRMGRKMNGLHPLQHRRTLIDALESLENKPFTLTGIAGIVLMDQMPTLAKSDRRILLNLNRFSDLHQLCQHGEAPIGNYRLGLHGAILEDVHPCTVDTIPKWLKTHDIWKPEPQEHSVSRLLVPTNGLDIPATIEVLRDWSTTASSHSTAIIIDPNKEGHIDSWSRALTEIGLRPPSDSSLLKSSPSIHWLGEIASIGIGTEAWSMSRIRGLGTQQSLQFNEDWLHSENHPQHTEWIPEMNSERIESLARSWHILGGYGALSRWLHALASEPHPAPWEDADEAGKKAECTQWWFLCFLKRLSPLLSSGERTLLENSEFTIGCFTQQPLPLPQSPTTGDEWISLLVENIDSAAILSDASSIHLLLEEHEKFRHSQSILGHNITAIGPQWVEGFLGLMGDLQSPKVLQACDQIRILTPNEALGVSADIIVLTHLTATNWSLRTEKLPWLTEVDCRELDLCRADSPLRSARHTLHHLVHASSVVILVDATGLDDDCQPATPLAEWLANHSGADTSEAVSKPTFLENWPTASGERTRGHHLLWKPATIEMVQESGTMRADVHLSGRSIRDSRQRAGLALRALRQPLSPPLNPDSVSIPLDSGLMQDRLRRQPTIVQSEEQYLGMELHARFCGMGDLKIVPGTKGAPGDPAPRQADQWPVLGGKSGRSQLLAIDPRPLKPSATSLPIFDERNGMTGGAEFARKRWSASRLQRWQTCPRQGWLERRLNAAKMEQQEEDLDARIRGDLVHQSLGALFEQVFSLSEGDERSSTGSTSLAHSGQSVDDMFTHILDYIGGHAPWLEREDATAAQRRHDLVGMSRKAWLDWLASPQPTKPSGRLGNMLTAEMKLYNSTPISIEWSLNGMTLPHPDGRAIKLTGFIDRVDIFSSYNLEELLLNRHGNWIKQGAAYRKQQLMKNHTVLYGDPPFRHEVTKYSLIPLSERVKEPGPEPPLEILPSIAPINWTKQSTWTPHRLVIIRDIKSVDGPSKSRMGNRHRKALFDELQLGLYARCWEISHPGDLVIGVGISEVGTSTNHSIEVSPAYAELLEDNGVGSITTLTHDTHRFPDEDSEADSDPFRAWMMERLTTAFDVAEAADSGRVHATPEEGVCTWCSVKEACGLASIVGGDSSWN